jgi:hypothetical protein
MRDPWELVERTERLLARVAEEQRDIAKLQRDLAEHHDRLRRGLEQLHRTVAARSAEVRHAPAPERGEAMAAADEPTLAEEPPAPAAERRRWARRAGNPTAVLVHDTRRGLAPFDGWVLDRSAGGVCLLVDEELPVGAPLELRPAGAARSFAAKVRHCRSDCSHWRAGCQFPEPLAWLDLRLFG